MGYLEIIMFLLKNASVIAGALVLVASGLLAIALVIPGDQPDKFLQQCVDFLKSLSRKKK